MYHIVLLRFTCVDQSRRSIGTIMLHDILFLNKWDTVSNVVNTGRGVITKTVDVNMQKKKKNTDCE